MSKTEVILTHNIVGLGAESDQVKVTAGYARNYLIPQGFAIPLTAANKRRLEALTTRPPPPRRTRSGAAPASRRGDATQGARRKQHAAPDSRPGRRSPVRQEARR